MSFPSLVQPSYAPTGWHLVSVTTRNDISGHVTEMNEKTIALKAGEAFDINTHHWNFLRSYHVLHGLPVMASMSGQDSWKLERGYGWQEITLPIHRSMVPFRVRISWPLTFWLINSYSRDSGGIIYRCLAFRFER